MSNKQHIKKFDFEPRIINPVKIKNAVFLSGNEQVREASAALKEYMPWIDIIVLADPITASEYKSDQASVLLFDDTALAFVDSQKIKSNNEDAVLVLLSSNELINKSSPSIAEKKYPYTSKADLIFAIDNNEFLPENIITSVVRCAEDKLNIEKYSKERRYIFLLVDDEPRWFSQFLPLLYKIIGQRADVMMTRTYEQALMFLFGVTSPSEIPEDHFSQGYGDDVVCLITDIFFPKNNNLESDAGRELVKLVNDLYPRIPIIIASKAKEAEDLRKIAYIMPKGDPGSLDTLSDYINDFTGMGDFVIRGKAGKEHYRIKHILELHEIILKAEKSTKKAEKLRQFLQMYGERDYFSTWLYMHGFRKLGDELRPRRDSGQRLVTVLKRYLKREILRMEFTPLIIDGREIFDLYDLIKLLKSTEPEKIQHLSDNDAFSNWLDRKGYPELAEEFRPVHGSGNKLRETLVNIVEKWITIYQAKP
ncbi:hypothetical protein B6I21_08900 [candidate division KSB1 bacterium 4572_119]|nr:MAG: hypothetical protein B6I21_08900 [candidate division KSB1 bacterium 4572_119]